MYWVVAFSWLQLARLSWNDTQEGLLAKRQDNCDLWRPSGQATSFSFGVDGVIDCFNAEDTFHRVEFASCRSDFAYSTRKIGGSNSVWVLDGASIHRDPEIVHFLRSLGIVPIFLPAYCPFFNPIDVIFGYIKQSFQRHYVESSNPDLVPFVVKTFNRFERFKMARVFQHCGSKIEGYFDPSGPLSKENSWYLIWRVEQCARQSTKKRLGLLNGICPILKTKIKQRPKKLIQVDWR
ncbi:unnamed protein product [Phytophthora fragariaefolia]|uniref:Unnamed protein product n=1 Tax=Phytophthora fragariaefolia TaxID=1490495 RepID=A0A9W6XJH0_9STRA|nr:unnamed protein product [Phytophthora fragariaefolia]